MLTVMFAKTDHPGLLMQPTLHPGLAGLFFVGTAGVLLRRNALIVLMSVEMQLAAGTLACSLSPGRWRPAGHVFAFFVMALAAAEAAVGLAIVSACFRTRRTANLDDVNALKG